MEKHYSLEMRRSSRKLNSIIVEDLLFLAREKMDIFPYNILIVLSVYKEDFPWVYEAGNDLIKTINSKSSKQAKIDSIAKFERIIECTYDLPAYREMSPIKKESLMLLRELPHMCYDMIDRFM